MELNTLEKGIEGEVVTKESSAAEIEGIASLLQGVVTPFAKAQEVSQQEATKRADILASVANKGIIAISVVAICIIFLSGYAISKGDSSLAEKMVIALLAFFGGIGAGKVTNKNS